MLISSQVDKGGVSLRCQITQQTSKQPSLHFEGWDLASFWDIPRLCLAGISKSDNGESELFYCHLLTAPKVFDLDLDCSSAQWFGMSQFSKKCTSDLDLFLCFLANCKSWASQIICLFHVKFDFWYSMVCLKFGYFGAYYIIFLVNGVCLISFLGPLGPPWYFQGVIFSYIGTFFVYQTLMSSLIEGMLILY